MRIIRSRSLLKYLMPSCNQLPSVVLKFGVWRKKVSTEKSASICHETLFFFFFFGGVGGWRTPNDIVYSKFERFPIYLNSYVKSIRHWLKLTKMEQSRLPFKACKLLYKFDCNGRYVLASNVRKCLSLHDFSHVWENQGVKWIDSFL